MKTGASATSDDATDRNAQRWPNSVPCHINELPRKLKRHRITQGCSPRLTYGWKSDAVDKFDSGVPPGFG